MMPFVIVFFWLFLSFIFAAETEKTIKNRCKTAVNQETNYRVSGIYGNPFESEWHPAAVYVLLREIQRFKLLQREFKKETKEWRFEFVEMVGGKTVVFVFHTKQHSVFCVGPNAFFVLRK